MDNHEPVGAYVSNPVPPTTLLGIRLERFAQCTHIAYPFCIPQCGFLSVASTYERIQASNL